MLRGQEEVTSLFWNMGAFVFFYIEFLISGLRIATQKQKKFVLLLFAHVMK